jgi:hypothetical protein
MSYGLLSRSKMEQIMEDLQPTAPAPVPTSPDAPVPTLPPPSPVGPGYTSPPVQQPVQQQYPVQQPVQPVAYPTTAYTPGPVAAAPGPGFPKLPTWLWIAAAAGGAGLLWWWSKRR